MARAPALKWRRETDLPEGRSARIMRAAAVKARNVLLRARRASIATWWSISRSSERRARRSDPLGAGLGERSCHNSALRIGEDLGGSINR